MYVGSYNINFDYNRIYYVDNSFTYVDTYVCLLYNDSYV